MTSRSPVHISLATTHTTGHVILIVVFNLAETHSIRSYAIIRSQELCKQLDKVWPWMENLLYFPINLEGDKYNSNSNNFI